MPQLSATLQRKQERHSLPYFPEKEKLFEGAQITFVACSRWLESLAKKSDLIKGQTITNIPNAINTNLFKPRDKNRPEKMPPPARQEVIAFRLRKNYRQEKRNRLFGISLQTNSFLVS